MRKAQGSDIKLKSANKETRLSIVQNERGEIEADFESIFAENMAEKTYKLAEVRKPEGAEDFTYFDIEEISEKEEAVF
jgi:hypothetical protein